MKKLILLFFCFYIGSKVHAQEHLSIYKIQFHQFINVEVKSLFKEIKAVAPNCFSFCSHNVHLNYIHGIVLSNDSLRIEIKFKEGIRLKEKDLYHAVNPCRFTKYSLKRQIIRRISIINTTTHKEIAVYE